jgi:hypothetical protein
MQTPNSQEQYSTHIPALKTLMVMGWQFLSAGIDSQLKVRENFYKELTTFGMCLKVALSSSSFFEDSFFTEKKLKATKKI